MVTKNWATGPILKNLHPEYREPQEQQNQEDYDKDVEQDAGDVGGSRRYPSKAQNADDNRKKTSAHFRSVTNCPPAGPTALPA